LRSCRLYRMDSEGKTAAIGRSDYGVRMEIQTTRFGLLTVEDDRVMSLPGGLLGFPNHNRFALVQTGTENYFFWLQSVDDPNLAFVVTDPTIFFKDYDVPVREETQQELQLTDPSFLQVFVICNKVGDWLTGNLLGPIVVNAENRLAQQVVLTEKKWTTRQPLLRLQAEMPLAKSA
jgi:flagellar assembly factor FliW